MPPADTKPAAMTATENAAVFLALVASAFLPLFLVYYEERNHVGDVRPIASRFVNSNP